MKIIVPTHSTICNNSKVKTLFRRVNKKKRNKYIAENKWLHQRFKQYK